MADNNRSIPESSLGAAYVPKSVGVQSMVFLGVLTAAPVIGWLVSHLMGGLSTDAQVAVYISFFLIVFLGYGLWFIRLGARAVSEIGKAVFFAVFRFGKRKSEQEGKQERLRMAESHDQLAIALQRVASSFFIVSIPVGLTSGLCATLYESAVGKGLRVCIVFGACLLWGFLLTKLARRGYFPPLPE